MQSFVPREAFVWKIHRELCIPKCARKVSGLSRNGPQVSESLACSGWKRPSGPNLGEHRQGTTLWQHVQGYLNSPTFLSLFFFLSVDACALVPRPVSCNTAVLDPSAYAAFFCDAQKSSGVEVGNTTGCPQRHRVAQYFSKFEKFQTLVLEISFPSLKQLKFNESSA